MLSADILCNIQVADIATIHKDIGIVRFCYAFRKKEAVNPVLMRVYGVFVLIPTQ